MAESVWSTDFRSDPAGKETLVIHCSDYRFVDATHKFLREYLKVTSYDLIVVPGAIHFLVSYLLPKYSWVARHWLKFFFKHHGTKRVIAFTHKDCGWYKAMHLAEVWSEKLLAAQLEDSTRAAGVVAEINERVTYEHYFVDFTDNVGVATNKVTIGKV